MVATHVARKRTKRARLRLCSKLHLPSRGACPVGMGAFSRNSAKLRETKKRKKVLGDVGMEKGEIWMGREEMCQWASSG